MTLRRSAGVTVLAVALVALAAYLTRTLLIRREVAAIISELSSPSASVRAAAVEELAAMRPERVVAPLIDVAADSSMEPTERRAAAAALARIGAPAVKALLHQAAHSKDTRVLTGWQITTEPGAYREYYAQHALSGGVMPAAGDVAVEAIRKELSGADAETRRVSAVALSRSRSPKAIGVICTLLSDPDAGVRSTATWALSESHYPEAAAPLVALLEKGGSATEKSVIEALGRRREGRAVEPLLKIARDAGAPLRTEAIVALGRVGDRRAMQVIIEALADVSPEVRTAGAEAIGCLGGAEDARLLAPLLDDKEAVVRSAAALSIGRVGNKSSVGKIRALLDDRFVAVRADAASALGLLKDSGAVERLMAALGDPAAAVQSAAAISLGHIGEARAVESLAVHCDQNSDTWWEAVLALEMIGGAEARAAVDKVVDDATLKEVAADYSSHITELSSFSLTDEEHLILALERYGTYPLAEALYWSGNGGLREASVDWARRHGSLDTLEASKDRPDRPRWPDEWWGSFVD